MPLGTGHPIASAALREQDGPQDGIVVFCVSLLIFFHGIELLDILRSALHPTKCFQFTSAPFYSPTRQAPVYTSGSLLLSLSGR